MTDTCPTCGSDKRVTYGQRVPLCSDPWHDQPDTDAVEAALERISWLRSMGKRTPFGGSFEEVHVDTLDDIADEMEAQQSTITALRAENERLTHAARDAFMLLIDDAISEHEAEKSLAYAAGAEAGRAWAGEYVEKFRALWEAADLFIRDDGAWATRYDDLQAAIEALRPLMEGEAVRDDRR